LLNKKEKKRPREKSQEAGPGRSGKVGGKL
jgi:hypothetical protein